MSRETGESDGHLRAMQPMLSWSTSFKSLNSWKHTSIITNGNLNIGLVQTPCAARDVAGIEATTDEPQNVFLREARVRDTMTRLQMACNSSPIFISTTYAEATLMGLITYLSVPDSSRCVDFCNALQDSKRMEDLIGPAMTTPNIAIRVGKKCWWCCNALSSFLSEDKGVSINRPGSHSTVYPSRIGLDVTVLKLLEDRLWTDMDSHYAVLIRYAGESPLHIY